jgi:hypothetical protein
MRHFVEAPMPGRLKRVVMTPPVAAVAALSAVALGVMGG